jgi:predicted acetyltransferase
VLHIRPATEADREPIAFVEGFSFNSQQLRPSDISISGTWCAIDAGSVVGTAAVHELGQWFGRAKVSCAGVAGVAVLPEHRGRGIAGTLMRELLRRRRAAGDALSVLYPANSQLYRDLGYEYAGLHPRFLVPVADLPASRAAVELADSGDEASVADLRTCFSRFAATHNGPVEWADTHHWAERVLAHKGEGLYQRTVVVPGARGIDGYASYFTTYDSERRAVVAACKHLVALTAGALNALLGYFRRFENSASFLDWPGSPTMAPVGLAAATNGFAIVPTTSRWMLRVLDVPRALEARGYPAGAEAEVVFSVEDPLFESNLGPWRLRVAGGRARVERADASPAKPLPAGLFSALYSGFANPTDLVALGALGPVDPRIAALSEVFSGPTPWMPDSF